MALREKVFLGRDNTIDIGFIANGAAVDASTFTRFVVKLTDSAGSTTTIDSSTDAGVFDTGETGYVSDTLTNILKMKIQDATSPPAAGNDYTCKIICYDVDNPDGIDWDSPFAVQVIAA